MFSSKLRANHKHSDNQPLIDHEFKNVDLTLPQAASESSAQFLPRINQATAENLSAKELYSAVNSSTFSCLGHIKESLQKFAFLENLSTPNQKSLLSRAGRFVSSLLNDRDDPPDLSALKTPLPVQDRLTLLKYYLGESETKQANLKPVIKDLQRRQTEYASTSVKKSEFDGKVVLRLVEEIAKDAPGFTQYFADIVNRYDAPLDTLMSSTGDAAIRKKDATSLKARMNRELKDLINRTKPEEFYHQHMDASRKNWGAIDILPPELKDHISSFPPKSAYTPRSETLGSNPNVKSAYANLFAQQILGNVADKCRTHRSKNHAKAIAVIARHAKRKVPPELALNATVKYLQACPLISNFRFDTFDINMFAGDPRLKNIFEMKINSSSRDFTGERDFYERQAFKTEGILDSAPDIYTKVGQYRFGKNPDFDGRTKPKYASLMLDKTHTFTEYGNSYITLAPHVKERATYHVGAIYYGVPNVCDHLHLENLVVEAGPELARALTEMGEVIVQNPDVQLNLEGSRGDIQSTIHGPVLLEDIKEVHLSAAEIARRFKYSPAKKAEFMGHVDQYNADHRKAKGVDWIFIS